MVHRSNIPSAISPIASGPQPTVFADNRKVTATLPTGESVEVLLYGATVTSWKCRSSQADSGSDVLENLWLSDKAHLDGSKAVRGGIPVVFPYFGPPPQDHATSKLPQHGFARISQWEYLGKSSSESALYSSGQADEASRSQTSSTTTSNGQTITTDDAASVTLDFGLTARNLSAEMRAAWPYDFSLQYSVTFSATELRTVLSVRNEGEEKFDFQTLLHTYLRVPDVTKIAVTGLAGTQYADKTKNMSVHDSTGNELRIDSEVDRVYRGLKQSSTSVVDHSASSASSLFDIVRDENLPDLVIWNPWRQLAEKMADFAPDDGYLRMICCEAGAVDGWNTLDAQDGFEAGQTLRRC